MASDPGNSDDNKPANGAADAPKPAAPAPASPAASPPPSPARGPYLIVTPQAANPPARQPAPPLVDPVRVDVDAEPLPDEDPHEPILGEPVFGDPGPGEPTYDEPTHHEPPRLVEPEPPAMASTPPSPPPAPRPAPTRPNSPALKARSADRLAALNGPPTDLAVAGAMLGVIDGGDGVTSNASLLDIDSEGELTLRFAVKIAGPINGAAIMQ